MFFSVCVGEIDVKKWGGAIWGGGAEIWGGGKWGGIGSAPPLKNTMSPNIHIWEHFGVKLKIKFSKKNKNNKYYT